MKTDDLIAMLAAQAQPVPEHVPEKRFGLAMGVGWMLAALITLYGYGPRYDLWQASADPMLWAKFAYPGVIAAISLLLALRLSRPGMVLGRWVQALWLPVAGMLVLALSALTEAPAELRTALWLGNTWTSCTASIVLVSAPIWAASMWAMKGLAPTQLTLAGACSGLFAGASGAVVYALHCPEMAAPFLLLWNGLGMLVCAGMGAALGPRILRW